MNFFWLDASALVKRYLVEIGTPLMNHLFTQVPPQQMVCLFEGVGEFISLLIRRRNSGAISKAAGQRPLSALQAEIVNQADLEKIERISQQAVRYLSFGDAFSDAYFMDCFPVKTNHAPRLVSAKAKAT